MNKDAIENYTRQAWLAGLGAYSKGIEFVTAKFDDSYQEMNSVITNLIAEGEQIEKDLAEKLNAKAAVEVRLNELKARLGLVSGEDKLELLTQKVEALTVAIEKIVAARLAKAEAEKTQPAASIAAPVAKAEVAKKPAKARAKKAKTNNA